MASSGRPGQPAAQHPRQQPGPSLRDGMNVVQFAAGPRDGSGDEAAVFVQDTDLDNLLAVPECPAFHFPSRFMRLLKPSNPHS